MKKAIRKMRLYHPLRNWITKIRQTKKLAQWEEAGRPSPSPHLVKQQTLKEYSEKYNLGTLVETGTYYGDMVEAMKTNFNKIYSVELDQTLYEEAKYRFKNDENVELLHGDSGKVLELLMKRISEPTLFWLDGHYSGGRTAKGEKDTPIYKELSHIFNSKEFGHVIIIDDARCFGSDPEYPSLDELKVFIHSKRENVNISVENDSIRVVPITQ